MVNTLITGGSSGIGRALATRLAKEGNSIFITGRDEDKLHSVCESVNKLGATCYYLKGDVSSTQHANQAVTEAIEKMGSVDVLIANAGVGRFKLLEEMTDEDFDLQFNTNVRGVFVFLRPVLRHMKERNSGQIIVTSSNLGFNTGSRCSLYAGTKYAVQAMVGAIRDELKDTEVKAATINPGSVDTPWYDGKEVDREKMLDVEEVVDAMMLIIQQGERSNIDHILLYPAYR
jgi:3-oxoacyl-[acyl-carrier protein] reductase